MAVTTTRNPVIVPIVQTDLALPIALWTGRVVSNGDVSGGDNTADIIWTRASPESLVSVEEINAFITGTVAAARNIRIEINPRELSGEVTSPRYRYIMVGTLSTISGSPYDQTVKYAYIFNPKEDQFLIEAITPNNNLENLEMNAWGYIWGVIARNRPGGPQRP